MRGTRWGLGRNWSPSFRFLHHNNGSQKGDYTVWANLIWDIQISIGTLLIWTVWETAWTDIPLTLMLVCLLQLPDKWVISQLVIVLCSLAKKQQFPFLYLKVSMWVMSSYPLTVNLVEGAMSSVGRRGRLAVGLGWVYFRSSQGHWSDFEIHFHKEVLSILLRHLRPPYIRI